MTARLSFFEPKGKKELTRNELISQFAAYIHRNITNRTITEQQVAARTEEFLRRLDQINHDMVLNIDRGVRR